MIGENQEADVYGIPGLAARVSTL